MKTYTYAKSTSPETQRGARRFLYTLLYYNVSWSLLHLLLHSTTRTLVWKFAAVETLVVALVVAVIGFIARRFPGDPRLPSRIDLTDDDTLRLYRRGRMYAEIPIADIASVTADPPGWSSGVALNLDSPVCGVGQILVGSYLIGFSDFVRRLRPPRMIQGSPVDDSRWSAETVARSGILALVLLGTMVIVGAATMPDPLRDGVGLVLAVFLAVLAYTIVRLYRSVDEISIRGDRIVVTRGWLRKIVYGPSDISSVTILPAGSLPERLCIEIGGDRAIFSSSMAGGYLLLLDRLQDLGQHPSGDSPSTQHGVRGPHPR